MIQNNKKTLMYAGAIIIGSGIAYAIYSSRKNKLPLVDNARVTEDETPTPEVPKSTKANYFASLSDKPLPTTIDYKFGSSVKF